MRLAAVAFIIGMSPAAAWAQVDNAPDTPFNPPPASATGPAETFLPSSPPIDNAAQFNPPQANAAAPPVESHLTYQTSAPQFQAAPAFNPLAVLPPIQTGYASTPPAPVQNDSLRQSPPSFNPPPRIPPELNLGPNPRSTVVNPLPDNPRPLNPTPYNPRPYTPRPNNPIQYTPPQHNPPAINPRPINLPQNNPPAVNTRMSNPPASNPRQSNPAQNNPQQNNSPSPHGNSRETQ